MVIFEEPFANLDSTTQIRLRGIIRDLKENRGTEVLIWSYDLIHVNEVSEHFVLPNKGEIVKDIQTSAGTLQELEHYFVGQNRAPYKWQDAHPINSIINRTWPKGRNERTPS